MVVHVQSRARRQIALIAANSQRNVPTMAVFLPEGESLYYEPFIMILWRAGRSLPRSYLILEASPSPSPRTPSLYVAVSNFVAAALGST